MTRIYYIDDALGKRQFNESDQPFRVGGRQLGGIVLPGVAEDQLEAIIAMASGHHYIQPANKSNVLYHNNELVTESVWLKSGDRVQIGDVLLTWAVQGDKVLINLLQQQDLHEPTPPKHPPPNLTSATDELPVHIDEPSSAQPRSLLRGLVLAIFTFLGLTALYLLMATSVSINISPKPDSLVLEGFPPPVGLWDTTLLFPGTYRLRASLAGHISMDKEVEIKSSGTSKFDFLMEELPGLLIIRTKPDRVFQITIDNGGNSQLENNRIEIARGSHQLRIETERYLTHQQPIEIFGYGKEQLLEIDLQPAWGSITIDSKPSGAEVSVDGVPVGTTPLETELMQGSHEFILAKPGYKPITVQQSIVRGSEITTGPFPLIPADGQLSLRSVPNGASVTVNDIFQGVTPVTLELPANIPNKLVLHRTGYTQAERSISLKPDQKNDLEVTLVAEYGTVFVSTEPVDAEILVDGKKPDQAGNRLRLSVKRHLLSAVKQGYITQTLTVIPRRNVTQNIEITLKPKEHVEQAQQEEMKKVVRIHKPLISTVAGQQLHLVSPDSNLVMGASRREAGRRANESRRLVRLDRPFYFARNEVTNGEFRRFRPTHDSGSLDGVKLNGENQPVVNISWDDAARFCNWLSKQQGLPETYIENGGKIIAVKPMNTGYRIPTEAEWAWVARKLGQPSEQRYPWNGDYPPRASQGNYADARIADALADIIPGYDDGYRGPAPIGRFPDWPEGFKDLGGNVAEWAHDFYAVYPGMAEQLVSSPSGPDSGQHHVVRGAGWRHGNITELRLSYRDYSNKPRYDLGFRIARYAE